MTTKVKAVDSTPHPRCRSCDSDVIIAPLHGAKGGPLLCLKCRLDWDQWDTRERQKNISLVEAFGFKTDGLRRNEVCYLTRETLEDAI